MTEARAGEPEVLSDFDRMTRPGFLADYASVEVTEVFAIPPGGPGLDAISDRLGNIVIQFPIELVAFQWFRTEEGFGVSVDWRPGTQPRPLTVSAQGEPDAVLGSYASARLS